MRSPFQRFLTLSLVCATAAACDRAAPKGDVTPADVVAGRVKTFDHFESPNGKFAIDFPEVWKGSYTVAARPDTTGGARLGVEFMFKPDPAWKVEPHPLIIVRVFTKAAWDRLNAKPGQSLAARLAAKGDDVFALSMAPVNPYKPGTPAAAKFDELMSSFLSDPVGLRLTPR